MTNGDINTKCDETPDTLSLKFITSQNSVIFRLSQTFGVNKVTRRRHDDAKCISVVDPRQF